jgi:hypothetical protein
VIPFSQLVGQNWCTKVIPVPNSNLVGAKSVNETFLVPQLFQIFGNFGNFWKILENFESFLNFEILKF